MNQTQINENPLHREPLQATPSMCYHCFDVLIDALENKNIRRFSHPSLRTDLVDASVECPLFITWEKEVNHRWQLRGCIGTLSPRPLATSVGEYALTSAFRDRRFSPITQSEVSSLRVGVSLLINYETCQDVYDWTVGLHGIVINFTVGAQPFNATYLPDVAKEQGWDHSRTLASLIRKAGYNGPISQELLKTIHCTRYQSSKYRLKFEEYVAEHCCGKSPLPTTRNKKEKLGSLTCSIN